MVADVLLQKKKVAIYVNGNNKRGLGHIYRALEIADEFYTKPDIYYDINQTNVKMFGFTTHNLIGVNGFGELLSKLQEKEYNLLINDVLTTSIDYMIAIKKTLPNAKIVNFEDDGEGIYKADLVFNALYQFIKCKSRREILYCIKIVYVLSSNRYKRKCENYFYFFWRS